MKLTSTPSSHTNTPMQSFTFWCQNLEPDLFLHLIQLSSRQCYVHLLQHLRFSSLWVSHNCHDVQKSLIGVSWQFIQNDIRFLWLGGRLDPVLPMCKNCYPPHLKHGLWTSSPGFLGTESDLQSLDNITLHLRDIKHKSALESNLRQSRVEVLALDSSYSNFSNVLQCDFGQLALMQKRLGTIQLSVCKLV